MIRIGRLVDLRVRVLVLVLVAVALLASCSPGERTAIEDEAPRQRAEQGDNSPGVFGEIPEVVAEVQPSVVAVLTDQGEGSGVVYDGEGIVVTNAHVVQGARTVRIALATGERVRAEVVATDRISDLAVLRVDHQGLPPLEVAEEVPRVGSLAIAIGNPLGLENTVTAGVISGLNRSIGGGRAPALVDLIQTDAAISPGNSGGALVDDEGRLVGINVAFVSPRAQAVSIGFAIPSARVTNVVEQLLESGEVEHAFLGIQPAPLTSQVAERFNLQTSQGVLVLQVGKGTPADEAGLRVGDIIVSAGGQRLEGVGDLLGVLLEKAPGDELQLTVSRDGKESELTARLSARAQSS